MLTYIFLFSLVSLVVLFSVKVFENKKNRRVVVLSTLSKLDQPIRAKLDFGAKVFEDGKQRTVNYVRNELPQNAKFIFLQAKKGVEDKYATILPNIRGSKVLSKDGKVSQFLRDISKHKKENGGGRIDE